MPTDGERRKVWAISFNQEGRPAPANRYTAIWSERDGCWWYGIDLEVDTVVDWAESLEHLQGKIRDDGLQHWFWSESAMLSAWLPIVTDMRDGLQQELRTAQARLCELEGGQTLDQPPDGHRKSMAIPRLPRLWNIARLSGNRKPIDRAWLRSLWTSTRLEPLIGIAAGVLLALAAWLSTGVPLTMLSAHAIRLPHAPTLVAIAPGPGVVPATPTLFAAAQGFTPATAPALAPVSTAKSAPPRAAGPPPTPTPNLPPTPTPQPDDCRAPDRVVAALGFDPYDVLLRVRPDVPAYYRRYAWDPQTQCVQIYDDWLDHGEVGRPPTTAAAYVRDIGLAGTPLPSIRVGAGSEGAVLERPVIKPTARSRSAVTATKSGHTTVGPIAPASRSASPTRSTPPSASRSSAATAPPASPGPKR